MLARGVHARVGAVVAALLVLTVLGAAPPAAAVPVAPTGLAPGIGDVVDASPVLSWERVADANGYDVEVSARSDFATKLYSVSTVNRRATPTSQLPMSDLYWRVRAKSSTGNSDWASVSFSRSRLAGPTLQAPADGELLDPPDEPAVLRWDPVAGATGYTVEIDRGPDPDWVGTVSGSTRTTSYTPGPLAGGSWSWRVTATLDGQLTFPSQLRSFSVGELADVQVTLPAEGQDLEDVVLDWDPVPGAVRYDLRVSTDEQFPANSIIDDRTVTGTRYSPAKTYDVAAYWWQVRAVDALGAAQLWGAVQKHAFTRSWDELATTPGHGTDPNPAPDPDGAPRLVFPADDLGEAVTGDVYFQWTPVRHATKYQLDVGTNENFSPNTFKSCTTSHTTFTPTAVKDSACLPSLNGPTYWRVKALDAPADVQGHYSAIRGFRFSRAYVELTSPANGATVDLPTLQWEPTAGAERYQVVVTSKTGRKITKQTYSTSWTPSERLDPGDGPYRWSVAAIDYRDVPTPLPLVGGDRTFSLTGDIPQTAADPLDPLEQGGPATGRSPALHWEPQPLADHYLLYIGKAGAGSLTPVDDEFKYPAATDPGTGSLAGGTYQWRVVAVDQNDLQIGALGDIGTFTVLDPQVVGGQQIALKGTSLDAGSTCAYGLQDLPTARTCPAIAGTPVLDWEPDANTAFYIVYVARDRNFQNMVYGTYSLPRTLPQTFDTRWIDLETLAESQAGFAYYWFVRPCKAATVCAPDPVLANHAFEKRSNPVTLLPVAQTANDITFSWQPYLATNAGAAPHAVTGERSDQEARTYELQVSDTSGFDHLVDEAEVDQPTYTAASKVYPEGNLFWRVRAYDGDDKALPWSTPQTLLKSSPRPAGILPSGTVMSADAFRWSVTPFAAGYDLEVYKNADTAASVTNQVLKKTVKEAAYAPIAPLPASVDYVWRTRRVDVSGNNGAWSDWSSYRVEGTAPVLELPATGATVPTAEALFTWRPVDGATSYRFERRETATATVRETFSTAALAWAPTAKLPAGAWQWRVTSLDAAGNALASSTWRDVSVQGGPAATSTPVITGSGTVGELLHATAPTWDVPDTVTAYQWLRNGATISGATGVDYEVLSADVGKSISVRATGTRAGYDPTAATSNAITGVLGPTASALAPPTLVGTAQVGSTLTGTLPTWDLTGVVSSYRWLRDGAVAASNTLAYTMRDSDLGKTIAFEVTGKKTGYLDAVVTTPGVVVTPGAAPTPSVAPSLAGPAKVGRRLSLRAGTWGSGARLTYQWLRDGSALPGATATSYTPVAADAAHALSVLVTATTTGYETGTATTASLTVPRMVSSTKLTVPTATVKARAGRKAKVRVTVVVTVSGWSQPKGRVRILDGKRVIAKVNLRSNGTARVTLSGMRKGKHTLVARYDGTSAAATSASTRRPLKVV